MTERGQKIKDAFRKKYGVDHPSQLPSVKEKIKQKRLNGAYSNMITNMKKTCMEKYGDANYNNNEKNKQTKLERYGDANYNNRPKMIHTNQAKYGMNVSENTLKSTLYRLSENNIGFNSKKYKSFLDSHGVTNISQLSSVKKIIQEKKTDRAVKNIFFGTRLKGTVIPLFSEKDYIGTDYNTLYKFKCCICNNEFEDTLYSGNIPRCLVCYPYNKFKSKIEIDISEFLQSNNIKCISHDRAILNGNEIDILIPDKKFGIEVDGILWHSELFGKKDRLYHLAKTNASKLKNVDLIHVWDWEWINKGDIIKSIITNRCGSNNRIFARKCGVVDLSEDEKSNFLCNNHIQGNDRSSVRLGLLYNSELVSVMTFSKSRYDKKYEWELTRFCNILNTSIIGGASKLFSYFLKKYNPKSIVSYSDRRFFTGTVYIALGMKLVDTTIPGYHYFHKNNCVPINRLHFQKHKLKSILKSFDSNLTEWQNMQLNGYDRIWDCGNLKYEWQAPLIRQNVSI